MEKDINLQIEDLKNDCVNLINQSGLPISVAYYLFKDIMVDLQTSYENYLKQARIEETKRLQALAQSQETSEVEE